jgi:uncharacterized protein (DUF1697 family)
MKTIPGNLKNKSKVTSGEVIFESKSSQKNEVLKELENAFVEAKEIKDGKKSGLTLEQILAS